MSEHTPQHARYEPASWWKTPVTRAEMLVALVLFTIGGVLGDITNGLLNR